MFSRETGVKMKAAAKFGLSFLVLLSVVLGEWLTKCGLPSILSVF